MYTYIKHVWIKCKRVCNIKVHPKLQLSTCTYKCSISNMNSVLIKQNIYKCAYLPNLLNRCMSIFKYILPQLVLHKPTECIVSYCTLCQLSVSSNMYHYQRMLHKVFEHREGWKQEGSKWFWIKKQIEPFTFTCLNGVWSVFRTADMLQCCIHVSRDWSFT